jgi:hypothetical protein
VNDVVTMVDAAERLAPGCTTTAIHGTAASDPEARIDG